MKLWILVAVCCNLLTVLPAMAAEFVNIATGSTGGTYYPVGSTMANIWREGIPGLKASAQSTGGTVNNLQLLAMEEAEVCISDGLYYDAYKGLGKYTGQPHTFLRGMVVLYPDLVHFMVAKGSGIQSIRDLKGKRVAVGPVGGSVPLMAEVILRAGGLDMRKDIRPEYLGHAETAAAFADKHIDAAFAMGSQGIASVLEMTTLGTAEIRDLDADIITAVSAAAPYVTPYTLAPGSYQTQNNPIQTLSVPNIVAVHEKLSSDLVYTMVRLLFERKADLVAVAAAMKDMKAEDVEKIRIPIHPGAERYYRERGLIR